MLGKRTRSKTGPGPLPLLAYIFTNARTYSPQAAALVRSGKSNAMKRDCVWRVWRSRNAGDA